jgi:hypothetical protein
VFLFLFVSNNRRKEQRPFVGLEQAVHPVGLYATDSGPSVGRALSGQRRQHPTSLSQLPQRGVSSLHNPTHVSVTKHTFLGLLAKISVVSVLISLISDMWIMRPLQY